MINLKKETKGIFRLEKGHLRAGVSADMHQGSQGEEEAPPGDHTARSLKREACLCNKSGRGPMERCERPWTNTLGGIYDLLTAVSAQRCSRV